MTKIQSGKSIERETSAEVFDVGYKPIIVTVHPKYIAFRLKGRTKKYSLGIERLYTLAVMAHIEDNRRKRKNGN